MSDSWRISRVSSEAAASWKARQGSGARGRIRCLEEVWTHLQLLLQMFESTLVTIPMPDFMLAWCGGVCLDSFVGWLRGECSGSFLRRGGSQAGVAGNLRERFLVFRHHGHPLDTRAKGSCFGARGRVHAAPGQSQVSAKDLARCFAEVAPRWLAGGGGAQLQVTFLQVRRHARVVEARMKGTCFGARGRVHAVGQS